MQTSDTFVRYKQEQDCKTWTSPIAVTTFMAGNYREAAQIAGGTVENSPGYLKELDSPCSASLPD